jgi:hypothetical protein
MWKMKAKVIPIIIGTTESLSRSFQKYLDDIPGKHSREGLQKTAILGTAHILRKILTYKFMNFKCIFPKLPVLRIKPHGRCLTVARGWCDDDDDNGDDDYDNPSFQ